MFAVATVSRRKQLPPSGCCLRAARCLWVNSFFCGAPVSGGFHQVLRGAFLNCNANPLSVMRLLTFSKDFGMACSRKHARSCTSDPRAFTVTKLTISLCLGMRTHTKVALLRFRKRVVGCLCENHLSSSTFVCLAQVRREETCGDGRKVLMCKFDSRIV